MSYNYHSTSHHYSQYLPSSLFVDIVINHVRMIIIMFRNIDNLFKNGKIIHIL